jgi:hypothetical protein
MFCLGSGSVPRQEEILNILPKHKQRFEEFLGTNLIGDTAMFQSNLLEHEKATAIPKSGS